MAQERTKFIAPCTENYGCSQNALTLYASDHGKVDFLECKVESDGCGLIWRDTTTCPEERVYDEEYFISLHRYNKNRAHRIRKAHLFLAILEQFTAPGHILEVGPALGYNLEAARERDWRVEGIDISDYIVKRSCDLGFDIEKGRLGENSKPDRQYDAILLKHVLEHYGDPFAALRDANRLLRPDGLVQIFVPNGEYWKAGMLRHRHKFYRYDANGIDHYVYFNRTTLSQILKTVGFEVVQENYPFFVPGDGGPLHVLERVGRNLMSRINCDQELMVIARKTKKT